MATVLLTLLLRTVCLSFSLSGVPSCLGQLRQHECANSIHDIVRRESVRSLEDRLNHRSNRPTRSSYYMELRDKYGKRYLTQRKFRSADVRKPTLRNAMAFICGRCQHLEPVHYHVSMARLFKGCTKRGHDGREMQNASETHRW